MIIRDIPWAPNRCIRMISEESCDTEDWSLHLFEIVIMLHNITVLLYFDQITLALVNIRENIFPNFRPHLISYLWLPHSLTQSREFITIGLIKIQFESTKLNSVQFQIKAVYEYSNNSFILVKLMDKCSYNLGTMEKSFALKMLNCSFFVNANNENMMMTPKWSLSWWNEQCLAAVSNVCNVKCNSSIAHLTLTPNSLSNRFQWDKHSAITNTFSCPKRSFLWHP